MSSLRARLVAAVLVVAAVGLLLLAAITYAEQRSFQLDRADDQARAGVRAVEGALALRGVGSHSEPDRGPLRGGPPRGGGPGVGLPEGTYGQLRDAHGKPVAGGDIVLDYGGQDATAKPAIPAKLAVGEPRTVSGTKGDENSYRVVATRDHENGAIVVVAIPLRDVEQRLNRLLVVEGFVIAGVLLLLAAVAWILVRVGLLPLDRISHTASRIAGGDLSHRVAVADERTEVGRVGLALNAMLDRLERAFAERQASEDRLRQFIADASHELRTPLASIRGYAELFRMGAAREPAEVERSMGRIEDEAARMGVLVEDLLTLARLDEVVDAPHGEVDLAHLARDAVGDAHATAPEREIAVTADAPAIVLGDAHQLRQVLGNLLRNALVHTPAGSPVEVSVAATDREIRLEVRDHGPGLPTDDPDALFERFWRAEGGRERGKSGAGLGLAIVAGIVGRHGGRVTAANAGDGGAAFVVTLPAAPVAAARA
jgi:two-component system, OmpR family, sensor kinase